MLEPRAARPPAASRKEVSELSDLALFPALCHSTITVQGSVPGVIPALGTAVPLYSLLSAAALVPLCDFSKET